jgi:hypothetical protein
MGRQIFVADCIGCAPKASAGKAERTARRVEYGQKKNPPGWVGELEVCPSGVSLFSAWRSLRRERYPSSLDDGLPGG